LQAKCPVIVAPESFESIDEIVFAYDGNDSSLVAIKQFTYLFPEFANRKITLIEINKDDEFFIKGRPKISDWLKTHYAKVNFKLLHGNAEEELFKNILEKKNLLLVMVAYGRNMFSTFLKESTAELVMKTTNLPLFIAHQW
jgi:hypothetical protein